MHEMRFGEMTAFEERPHSPYYGSADATPLFLVLLDEYERWTGDRDWCGKLEPAARAALSWIDEYGDLQGNGYVEYQRRNEETGLENQCWKDSWNSISSATARCQAPARDLRDPGIRVRRQDARRRLAREMWNDPALAERLEKEAADLKRRFNRDYWIADREYFALAIDGDGARSTR